jgi:putative cardiolipin synthase
MNRRLTQPSFILALLMLAASGCASLPSNDDRSESLALRDTDETFLGLAAARHQSGHPDQSGFHLLGSGLDAFVARAVLARNAESSIDAQYYLLHDDLVGRLFIALLLKAADRGVRVRLWSMTWRLVAAISMRPHSMPIPISKFESLIPSVETSVA